MARHTSAPRQKFMTLRLDEREYAALAAAAKSAGRNKGEILRAAFLLWLEAPGRLPVAAMRRDMPLAPTPD